MTLSWKLKVGSPRRLVKIKNGWAAVLGRSSGHSGGTVGATVGATQVGQLYGAQLGPRFGNC